MEQDLREEAVEAVEAVEEWADLLPRDPAEIAYVRNAAKKLPMLRDRHVIKLPVPNAASQW